MNDPIVYRQLSPAETLAAVDQLKVVYGAVFSLPPYNEDPRMVQVFADAVGADSHQPGFTMVTAWRDHTMIGFTYGYTVPEGAWRWTTDRPTPPELAAVPKFTVMEWAVLPDHRQQGVGRALIRALLAERPERWAVLTVNPEAEARVIYERDGWQPIASTTATEDWPSMHVLLLDRHPGA